jgi:hypothetical protein
MKNVIIRAGLLFLLCTAISAAVYFIFDTLARVTDTPNLRRAWVLILPVYAAFFSYLVFYLGPELYRATRYAALHPFQGTYYQYLGWRIKILEDESHCRWVSTDEVRKIVGQLASDHALADIFPTGHQRIGTDNKGYLRDDALILHLAQATTPQAIKFKNWAQRNIAYPANKTRERMGVTLSKPSADADD